MAGVAPAIVLTALCYAVAGMIGGLVPSNAAWRPPVQGVTIYIESNGIHTGIVLPKRAAGIDLDSLTPPGDLANPRYGAHRFAAFGWGERDFYLNTPTWKDVRPTTIAHAVFGSDTTLVHVEHIAQPVVGKDARRLIVTPRQYRRLVAYIRASYAPGGKRHPGYAAYDVFYDARGHYSGITTCNAWTGDALRFAGVKIGAWTPFPSTVLRWF